MLAGSVSLFSLNLFLFRLSFGETTAPPAILSLAKQPAPSFAVGRNGPGFPAKLHHHLEGENSAGFAMGPSVVGSHCFTRSTLWPSHRNLLVCHHERPLACTHLIQKRQWIWQKHGKSSACETLFFVSSDYLHMSHGSIDFSKKMQVSHVLGRLDKNIGPNPCQSAIVKVQHSFLGELLHIPVVKIEGM